MRPDVLQRNALQWCGRSRGQDDVLLTAPIRASLEISNQAGEATQALKEGDELSKFAEALTTHGIALARLGNFSKARATLEQAIRVSHDAGDPESGGIAALAIVEELTGHLPVNELLTYFSMAESELGDSQHPQIQTRLGKTARRFIVSSFGPDNPS